LPHTATRPASSAGTRGATGMIGITGTTGIVLAVVAHGPGARARRSLSTFGWIEKNGRAQVAILLPVTRLVLLTVRGNRCPRGGRGSSPPLRFPSVWPMDLHRSVLRRRWIKLEGLTAPITMH
jgi:hypothetical protein